MVPKDICESMNNISLGVGVHIMAWSDFDN